MKDIFDNYDLITEQVAETMKSRNTTHGDPVEQHEYAAGLYSAFLGIDVTASDVAILDVLKKISRYKTGEYDRDHSLDAAGYCEIWNMCEERDGDCDSTVCGTTDQYGNKTCGCGK